MTTQTDKPEPITASVRAYIGVLRGTPTADYDWGYTREGIRKADQDKIEHLINYLLAYDPAEPAAHADSHNGRREDRTDTTKESPRDAFIRSTGEMWKTEEQKKFEAV